MFAWSVHREKQPPFLVEIRWTRISWRVLRICCTSTPYSACGPENYWVQTGLASSR